MTELLAAIDAASIAVAHYVERQTLAHSHGYALKATDTLKGLAEARRLVSAAMKEARS